MRWALCATALAATATAASAGPVCYVDDDAPTGGDGMSWATAYRFLQDALAAAGEGDVLEIRVAQGHYTPDCSTASPAGSGDRSTSFLLVDGVTILGGFAGLAAPDPDERDPVAYETTLSGDLLGDDAPQANRADNSFHVVYGGPVVGMAARLDGVTITAGQANGGGVARRGAGVLLDGSTAVLANCVVRDNHASGLSSRGGGAYAVGGAPRFEDCTFEGNTTTDAGGAVFAEGSQLWLNGGVVRDNTAPTGGGLHVNTGTLIALGTHFASNSAVEGGAVSVLAPAAPMLLGCTFEGNSATSRGGALHFGVGADGTISDGVFDANTAGLGGGAAYLLAASPQFTGCTFTGNLSLTGGALLGSGASSVIVRCRFEANAAELGGALAAMGGSPTIDQCTFEGNTAAGGAARGGAVYAESSAPVLRSCVMLDNTAGQGGALASWLGSGPTIESCAMAGNTATDSGGAAFLQNVVDATIVASELIDNAAGTAGGGLASVGGANTSLIDSVICDNVPDPASGAWDDDGGNTIGDACLMTCPADLTQDALVDTPDLLMLLSLWGEAGPADLDADGTVSAADLLALLAAWGPCPEQADAGAAPSKAPRRGAPASHGNNPVAHGNNPRGSA